MNFLLVLHDDATKFTVLRPIRDDVDSAVHLTVPVLVAVCWPSPVTGRFIILGLSMKSSSQFDIQKLAQLSMAI